MQRKSVAVFTATKTAEAGTWPIWFQYDLLPQDAKDENSGVWDTADLDTPSENQHFFFKSDIGYFHTSELIEVREGHPLYGQYTFYTPCYGSNGVVLAVNPAGSFVIGTFTYA